MRELIQGLSSDVRRLLMTGGTAASGDASLSRRTKSIRELAAKVPALGPLADAAERTVTAPSRDATRPLLQLLTFVRQVNGSLSSAEEKGDLAPPEPGGPWSTALSGRDAAALIDLLKGSSPQRSSHLTDAIARPGFADLRLLQPLLDTLGTTSDDLAELLTDRALPAFGKGLVGELKRGLNMKGNLGDARKLSVLNRLEPKAARALCRTALAEGNWVVQVQALRSLAAADPAEAERVALDLLAGKLTPQLRGAALSCLAVSKSERALELLLAALPETGKTHEGADDGLRRSVHPKAGHAILEALKAAVAEVESLTPPPKSAKRSPKPPLLSKADQARRQRADEMVSSLADILMARADLKGIETVLLLMRHPVEDIRDSVGYSFQELGPNARPAVPLLIQALEDDTEEVRAMVADGLGNVGTVAPEALPALVRLLEDKRWWVQANALEAMEKFGELAVGPLSEALQSDNPQVRATAATALGELTRHALPVVRDLLAALKDRSSEVRRQAAGALGRIAQEVASQIAPVAVPALLELTRDRDDEVRRTTFLALRDFGPDGRAALSQLRKMLKDPTAEVRQMALWVLAAMGNEAADAVPEITKLVKDRSSNVRDAAKSALEEIGAD